MRVRRVSLLVGLALAVATIGATPARSVSATATSIDCTESALDAAVAAGGTVDVDCDSWITIHNEIDVTGDVTIKQPDGLATVALRMGPSTFERMFKVEPGARLELDGVTVSGAYVYGTDNNNDAQGGAVYNAGTLVLSNCTFQQNVANGAYGTAGSAYGGAIYNVGTLDVTSSTFTSNSASGAYAPNGTAGAAGSGTDGTGGSEGDSGSDIVGDEGSPGGVGGDGLFDQAGGRGTNADAPGGLGAGGAIYNAGTMTIAGSTFTSKDRKSVV